MKYIEFDETRRLDMILLGRVTIDFNPVDYFKPLKESSIFKKYVGGSTANTAIGLSRLGKLCGFLSKVSNDQFGDYVLEYLEKEKIDISKVCLCKNDERIGLTFTEILSETESNILMYRNQIADLQLSTEDIDEEYISTAKCLLISGTALSASPSREAVLKALALAKKTKTSIIFDVDYRPYNWTNLDEISLYNSLIAREADIIIGSREEFNLTERLIKVNMSDTESAKFWHSQNAKIVVIKHGKNGSTAYIKEEGNYSIKPFPVEALKSFGGGDGYAAAFLYGILEGWDIMKCLEYGSAEAAMLVASHACSEDMPTLEEVSDFIRESKEKYGEMVVRL